MKPTFPFDIQLFADPPTDPKNPDPKNPDPKLDPPDPNAVDHNGERLYKEKHVKDLRSEAQKSRERAEAAETKLRERDEADETERQKKLKDEKKFEELAESERLKREKTEKDAADKITAAERRIIRAEVKALAIAAGLLDADDIDLIDLAALKIENDKVIGAEKVVEDFKTAKPHKFVDPKNNRGGLNTGNPNPGGKAGDVDYRKLKPEDQAEIDRRLRAGKT
jgi:hypothetical protein